MPVCSLKDVEDFWDVHFFLCYNFEVVDLYVDGFFGNLLTLLIYYFEMGNVGMEWLLDSPDVDCTCYMTAMY